MTSRKCMWCRTALLAATATAIGLVGCGGEPEPEEAAIAPRRTAPPPPKPTITPVADLMAELSIDERIMLPEELAPGTDGERRAILEFFDAFARGDDVALSRMMSLADRLQLEELAKTDSWPAAVEGIEGIELQTGMASAVGQACVLAVFAVGFDFQPQLWYYDEYGEGYTFEAAPTPPGMMDRLHGDNWIAKWHEILQDEVELANALEEEIEPVRQVLAGERPSGGPSFGESPTGPGSTPGPGKPPGRRKPPSKPRKAPGPGG